MVPADRKSRILAAISETPAPTRRELLRRQTWLVLAGVAGALSLFWIAGGLRVSGRPPSLIAWTSVGTACFGGSLSNQWTVENFSPNEYLPRGVRLAGYFGDAACARPPATPRLSRAAAVPPPMVLTASAANGFM